MEVDESASAAKLHSTFRMVHTSLKLTQTKYANPQALEDHVISTSLPFLRCCAMLFRNLTDVPEPPALHGQLVSF